MKAIMIAYCLSSLVLASFTTAAYSAADNNERTQIMPDEIKWTAVPSAPGLKLSWLTGAQDKAGLYELRVHLDKGAVVPPHTHPDRRCATVLSGDLYAAEGTTVDATKVKRFPRGSFHCVEAGVPHYVLAKDSEVDFQDSGVAPTGTTWVKK